MAPGAKEQTDRQDSASPLPHGDDAPTVMLVLAQDDRRQPLIDTIARVAPGAQIEPARSAFDALLRSSGRRPIDLLLLEQAKDGAAAPSLIRHMARVGQRTAVLVFGETAEARPDEVCDIWSWGDAETVLRDWYHDFRHQRASHG